MKWQIGDVTVTKVVELTSASLGEYILPDATADELQQNPVDWSIYRFGFTYGVVVS